MNMILRYIVTSILYALMAVPIVILFRYKYYRKPCDTKREIAIMLFFMTCSMIICQTVIPPQWVNGNFTLTAFHAPDFSVYRHFPQLQIGWLQWMITLRNWAEIAVNIGGNLLIFMPIGFLAPYIWKPLKAKVILVGFLFSCSVESVQLFTDRMSDYNDIILNTIGCAIGYCFFLIICRIRKNAACHSEGKAV